jgi:protocatechuate 3,4-dioxygenase beta subunit
MRAVLALLSSIGLLPIALAAEPPGASFDIQVNLADQRLVHLALTVPDGTTQRLQVDGDVGLTLHLWWSVRRLVTANLVSTSGGAVRELTDLRVPTEPDGQVLHLSFSACGDRGISRVDAAPGVCQALPRMAKADRVLPESCGFCTGPYEGMPATIPSHARIAPPSEPGEPLTLTGRVLGPDGQPRAGIIVYAYHTDRHGIYRRPDPPRSDLSTYHGVLRGWARSDAQGHYTFDTIRPASYPDSTVPQHIHMHVIEPGCATYFIDEVRFTDDPMLKRESPMDLERESPGIGGPAIVTPHRKGQGWEVTRDIHLGEKVPGYVPCQAAK